MTYRDLIIKLMKLPGKALDQNVVIFNEEDEKFYGCTGHDVHVSIEEGEGVDPGQFFLIVNI